jgi:hypothetical protein
MSLKLLAILGGVAALCTAPLISNISHSVVFNSNTTRVNQNDAVREITRFQDMEDGDSSSSPIDIPRYNHNRSEQIAESYSVQESSFDLELANLRDPYTLTVRPTGGATQLKGTIKLNGKVLKTLGKGVVKFNLSPYLRKGRQKLEIFGSYRPMGASVQIALEGPSAETTQEVSGNGTINQIIVIDVN